MVVSLSRVQLLKYQKIVAKEIPAAYLIAKKIPVEAQDLLALSLEELWQLHEEGIKIYRQLKKIRIPNSLSAMPAQGDRARQCLRHRRWQAGGRRGGSRVPEVPKLSLLDLKIELGRRILESCHFCERRCSKNRKISELGTCEIGQKSLYASEFLHLGEEPELIPSHTIFFAGCNFTCVYCQNFDIARNPQLGREAIPQELAKIIHLRCLEGAKNVNFVGGNPDPHLLTILKIIREVKVNTPMIWNSNMYTSLEGMKLLEGVVDLYLGDFRYGCNGCAQKYSKVPSYFKYVSRNFRLAYDQADVILRHLVLPGHLECCTKPIMEWVSQNIPEVYFNLMFQYHPCYRASFYPEINRYLTLKEKDRALELAQEFQIQLS